MKKVRSMLIAVLTLLLAFSLFACGGKDDGKKGADGAPDPSDVKGEKVTAEEWAKAFDFSNVTNVTVKMSESVTYQGEAHSDYDLTKYDGDKWYNKYTDYATDSATNQEKQITVEVYGVKENGKQYEYSLNADGATWSRAETDYFYSIEDAAEDTTEYVTTFDKYTYDSDKKAYVYTETESEQINPATEEEAGGEENVTFTSTVKIADGKLAVVELSATDGTNEMNYTVQFYDYGKTSVTLPTVSGNQEDDDDTDTASELGRYTNVQTFDDETMTTIIELKANGVVALITIFKGSEIEMAGAYTIEGNTITITYVVEFVDGTDDQEMVMEGTIKKGESIKIVKVNEETLPAEEQMVFTR